MAPSNLMNTDAGRFAMREAVCYLTRRRMARFFKGRFGVEAYRVLSNPGTMLDVSEVLGEFNEQLDDEVLGFYGILGQIGCLPESIQETTIYVDSVNGSDTDGTGSEDEPWQSLWFLPLLPQVINHPYRIVFLNDLIAGDVNVTPTFGPNGSLAFVGQGDPVALNTSLGTGPFTATTVTSLNGVAYLLQYTGLPFGADEMYGYFVRTQPGSTTENHAVQMHHHSGTFPGTFIRDAFAMSSNDEIDFVRPPITILLNSLNLEARGPSFEESNTASRLAFFNLNLDVSASSRQTRLIRLRSNCDAIMSFCRIIASGTQNDILEVWSDINHYKFVDSTAVTLCNSSIENMNEDDVTPTTNAGLLIVNTDFPTGMFGIREVRICAGQNISCLDSRAAIEAYNSFGRLKRCAISQFGGYQGSAGMLLDVLVAACNPSLSSASIVLDNTSTIKLWNLYLYGGGGENILAIWFGDTEISNCEVQSATSFTGYGIVYHGIGRVLFGMDPSTNNWLGVKGQIYYNACGVSPAGDAPLPAANSATTELDATTPPASGDVLGGVVTFI